MIWYEIPGWPGYRISHKTDVLSLRGDEPRLLKPGRSGPYRTVSLMRDGKPHTLRLHVLMALTFLGPRPPGHKVCHGPGGLGDDSISNLSYQPRSRGTQVTNPLADRTQCDHGHDFTPDNTYWRKAPHRGHNKVYRACRQCRRDRRRA